MTYIRSRMLGLAWALVAAGLVGGCDAKTTSLTPTSGGLITDVQEQPWEGRGRVLITEHYRIYTTVDRGQLIEALPGFMEAAYYNYEQITGLRGGQPQGRMAMYMMSDRHEWEDLTRHVVGPASPLYLSIQAGGYCYRGVGVFWQMQGLGTLSVASHEGLHQVLHYRLKDRLPMWLEEGMCTLAEGYEIHGQSVMFTPARNVLRYDDLRESIVQRDRTIPLERLLEMDAGDAVIKTTEHAVGYYGQLWALSMYIRSVPKYRMGMERLLADAQAGKLNEALKLSPTQMDQLQRQGRLYNRRVSRPLFEHYISSDLKEFDRGFRAYARKLSDL